MGDNYTDDVSAVFVPAVHEILSDMPKYGGDVVVTKLLQTLGQGDMAPTLLSLLSIGVPTADELQVRLWKTRFVGQLLDTLGGVMGNEDPNAFNQLFSDYDNIFWKKLTVVLGDPLGPAIIPFLKSTAAAAQNQSNNATAPPTTTTDSSAQDLLFQELLQSVRTFGIKNLLHNEYLPIPCLRQQSASSCPASGLPYVENFAEMYRLTSNGEEEEDFAVYYQDALFQYFEDQTKGRNLGQVVGQILGDNRTATAGKVLNQGSEVDNHMVDVLNGLALGEYSMQVDEQVLQTGYDPRTAVCMTNITAAMYENPETLEQWVDGLGLQVVSTFPTAGDLSSRASVLVDPAQNAVVVALEGIPVIHHYFQRGFFGWIWGLVGGAQEFLFPCQHYLTSSSICIDMAHKYQEAYRYEGFAPLDSVMVNRLKPALEEAAATVRSGNPKATEKPKLYITGHSLGGPLAKNTLAQVLLRGYDEAFSSVDAYAFGGPVVGNEQYLEMVDEVVAAQGANLYQVENSYDPIPYFPTILATEEVNKRNTTLRYDLIEDRFVREEPLKRFKGMPTNVFLSFEGAHAPKTQYLPLARALLPEYDYSTCEYICSVEQCGNFKCQDTCRGVL